MYSFKEKQKHFSELQNPDAASLDLKLLTQKTPSHPLLRKFSRSPQRYANEILYQLLDVAERDEIRNNRRPPVFKSNVVNGESSDPDQQDKISDVTDQIVEDEERAEEAELRVEEAEERAEEAELRAEEAEERADNDEAALEQEKKKVATTSKPVSNPKVKSKSGKSTQKLTGTTSPTRKSRQRRSSTTTES